MANKKNELTRCPRCSMMLSDKNKECPYCEERSNAPISIIKQMREVHEVANEEIIKTFVPTNTNSDEAVKRKGSEECENTITCWHCNTKYSYLEAKCPECKAKNYNDDPEEIDVKKPLTIKANSQITLPIILYVFGTCMIVYLLSIYPKTTIAVLAVILVVYLESKRATGRVINYNPAMICPHCKTRGRVTTDSVQRKKGISGAKATGAILTGGVSLLATGLSRKEGMTAAHCLNCGSKWDF